MPPIELSALRLATDFPEVASEVTRNFTKYGLSIPSRVLAGTNNNRDAAMPCKRGSVIDWLMKLRV